MNEVARMPTLYQPATYEIRVPGEIGEEGPDWTEGLTVTVARPEGDAPVTTLAASPGMQKNGIAQANVPQAPHTPCTEIAPTGSSTRILSKNSTEKTTRTPPMAPVNSAPSGVIV